MKSKEIFEAIDLSKIGPELKMKLVALEKATEGFTNDRADARMDASLLALYNSLKEKKPEALKNVEVKTTQVEEKVTKIENGKKVTRTRKTTKKVAGKKKSVKKKTPRPSQPLRKATVSNVAREIRKPGESWSDALTRAKKVFNDKKQAQSAKAKKALDDLRDFMTSDKYLKGWPRTYGKENPKNNDLVKDLSRKAEAPGRRVSDTGRVYYENRDNRSDREADNFPRKIYLKDGGAIEVGKMVRVVDNPFWENAMGKKGPFRRKVTMIDGDHVFFSDGSNSSLQYVKMELGGEVMLEPTILQNNPDYITSTATMGEWFEKGGKISSSTTYVPNRSIKELSITLGKSLKKLKGTDIVDGVYVKNDALNTTSRTSISSVDGIFDDIVSMANLKGLKRDIKSVKKDDIQKLLDAGYDREDLITIYFGPTSLANVNIDNDIDLGLLGLDEYNLKSGIKKLLEVAKSKTYEIGLKYPDFDWSDILTKYKIDKNGKDVNGVERISNNNADKKTFYVYRIFEGNNVVVGTSVDRVEIIKGKKVDDDSYRKDPNDLKKFKGGYWSIVSSDKKIIKDIAKMILRKKSGYVKNMDIFVNNLGGVSAQTLDSNKIPYELGGEVMVQPTILQNNPDYITSTATMGEWFEKGGSVGKSWKPINAVYYDSNDYNYPYTLIIGNLAWGISEEFDEPVFRGNIQKEFFMSTWDFAQKSGFMMADAQLPTNVLNKVKAVRSKDFDTLRGKRYPINPSDYPAFFEKGGKVNPLGYSVEWSENNENFQREFFDTLDEAKNFYRFIIRENEYGYKMPISLTSVKDGQILMGKEFAKGGQIGFEGLARKVAKRYEGKPVPKEYQKDYGKTYTKEEAMEVGRKVAAKVYRQQQAKMANGGKIASGSRALEFNTNGGPVRIVVDNEEDASFISAKLNGQQFVDAYIDFENSRANSKAFDKRVKLNADPNWEASEGALELELDEEGYEQFSKGGALYHRLMPGDEVLEIYKDYLIIENDEDFIYVIDFRPNVAARIQVEEIEGENTIEAAKRVADRDFNYNKYAMGGSLDAHGLEEGDLIVEDEGAYINVLSEDGKIYYVDLGSGERSTEPPLPFEHGGEVKIGDLARLAKKYNKTAQEVADAIREGAVVEREHTDDQKKAMRIAVDHLDEDFYYYPKLKAAEGQVDYSDFYEKGGQVPEQFLDSKGERKIDAKSIAELTDYVMALPQTKSIYYNEDAGEYIPSRRKLHADIINTFKDEVVCITEGSPIAIFMGGSPASGKSSFLRKYSPYLLKEEILKVDADEIRAMLPEYEGYNAAQTHLETKDIVNTLLSDRNIGIPCDFDLIYDGTMNSVKSYIPLISILRKRGYKIFIVYMDNVPKDVVIKRALERYRKTGRFVPLEVIEDFYAKGKTAFNELKKDVDGFMVIDGSNQDYKIIEQGGMKLPQNREYSKLGTKIDPKDIPVAYKKGGKTKKA